MPGSRISRVIMVVVTAIIVLGLVLTTAAFPTSH
jgi:hypothetical protein